MPLAGQLRLHDELFSFILLPFLCAKLEAGGEVGYVMGASLVPHLLTSQIPPFPFNVVANGVFRHFHDTAYLFNNNSLLRCIQPQGWYRRDE